MRSNRKGLDQALTFERKITEIYGHLHTPLNDFFDFLSKLKTTHGEVNREIEGIPYKIMNYNPYTTRKVPKL